MVTRIASDPRVQVILADAEWKLMKLIGEEVSVGITKIGAVKHSRVSVIQDDEIEIPLIEYSLYEYMTVQEIMRTVAKALGMRIGAYKEQTRQIEYVNLRKICAYILYIVYGSSYVQIGRLFGGMDHTTIMHYIKSANGLLNLKNKNFCHSMLLVVNALNTEVKAMIKEE